VLLILPHEIVSYAASLLRRTSFVTIVKVLEHWYYVGSWEYLETDKSNLSLSFLVLKNEERPLELRLKQKVKKCIINV
jgi:ribosomal protein S8